MLTANHSSIIITLAGTAFFMHGMTMASEALRKLSANRTRDLLAKLDRRPLLGVGVGFALTLMIQSSGAVTAMLVGLGSAGVVTLRQVMAVILGTAVGTTFTVQLISLNVTEFGLPIFALSFMIYFLTERKALRNVSKVLMGFGLIFFGLEVIALGTDALRQVSLFQEVIAGISANPLYAVCVTAFFTALVHSSAVTIGFAMVLTMSGSISLADSVYWVFGANIGTAATALLASMGGNYIGRQIAWAHFFYKLASVALFVPVALWLMEWMSSGSPQRDIANFHTLFNVLAALVFLPGVKYGSILIERMFPPGAKDQEFSAKFLHKGDYDSPPVILAYAEREVLRMGDMVRSMLEESLTLFRNEDPELKSSIRARDDKVDFLTKEINLYLTEHLEYSDSETQSEVVRIISFATDLESVGDVIDNSLVDMAKKKHHLKLEFSSSGWKDLEKIHSEAVEICRLSLSCFQMRNSELASKLVYKKRDFRKLEQSLRDAHFERLAKRQTETINSSSIHLDVLTDYRRIVGLLSNHAYMYLKTPDRYSILPRGG